MCTVSIKEFSSNPAKYFLIACSENVTIVDEDRVYNLEYQSREQVITDEDLKNSYSPEEFKSVMRTEIHRIFSAK